MPATAVSSPDMVVSARPSITVENGELAGSPSSYRIAVGVEPASKGMSSSGPESQRCLLPQERLRSSLDQHTLHSAVSADPRYSPGDGRKIAPLFSSVGASRKLQSMVTLKVPTG